MLKEEERRKLAEEVKEESSVKKWRKERSVRMSGV